jgi:hypothetical protein
MYIGKDAKNNPNYVGSGTNLKIAIKEYGKENFKKEIIEHCNNIKHLIERETYWLNYHDAQNNPLFYNKTNKPFGNSGLSEETKDKISKSNKNKIRSEQHKINVSNGKKGVKHKTHKKGKNHKNFNKPKTEEHKQKLSKAASNTIRTKEWKLAIRNNRHRCIETKSKPIQQLDKNNNIIQEYRSITEAKKETNIKGISNALIGLSKTAGGFIWKYKVN